MGHKNILVFTGSGAVPAEDTTKPHTDRTQVDFPTFNLCFLPLMTLVSPYPKRFFTSPACPSNSSLLLCP